MEGHPQSRNMRKETIEEITVETFFKGCKDHAAVEISMLKDPETIADAVKMVRKAISNRKITSGRSYWSKAVSFVEDDSDLSQVRLARPVYPHQHRDRSYSPQRRYQGVNSTFPSMHSPFPSWSQEERLERLERLIKNMQRYNVFPDAKYPDTRTVSPVRLSTLYTPPRSPVRSLADVECFRCHQKGHYASSSILPRSPIGKNVNAKTPESSLKYQGLNPQAQVQSKMMSTVTSPKK